VSPSRMLTSGSLISEIAYVIGGQQLRVATSLFPTPQLPCGPHLVLDKSRNPYIFWSYATAFTKPYTFSGFLEENCNPSRASWSSGWAASHRGQPASHHGAFCSSHRQVYFSALFSLAWPQLPRRSHLIPDRTRLAYSMLRRRSKREPSMTRY
jgi:hypothetical protein